MEPAFKKKAFRPGAFTVLELLISVALVGILAVLAMVSFKAVSASQNNIRCISNLRQTGAAMLNYAADCNQTLKSFHGGDNINEMWSRKLFYGGYLTGGLKTSESGTDENAFLLKNIDAVGKLLRCPTGVIDPTFATESPNVRSNPRRWGWQTYGLGMYQSDFQLTEEIVSGKRSLFFGVRIAAINQPARYILLADSSGAGPNFYQNFRLSRVASEGGVCLRHNGKANAFFLDGHVASIDKAEAQQLGVPGVYTPEK